MTKDTLIQRVAKLDKMKAELAERLKGEASSVSDYWSDAMWDNHTERVENLKLEIHKYENTPLVFDHPGY